MKGPVQLAVNTQVVNIMPPTAAGNQTSDYFTMKNYGHVDIVIQTGTVTSACTITVLESATNAGTAAAAIAFDYYKTAAAGDTFAARATATTSGVSTGTTNDLTWVISIDASQLTDGDDWLSVNITTAATLISMVAIPSGSRFGKEIPTTTLT